MKDREVKGIGVFVASGVCTGVAFLFPESVLSLLLGWVAVFLLCLGTKLSHRHYRNFFIYGMLLHAIGFYWLPSTITYFGGFSLWASVLLFLLFCSISSIQFLFCAWLYKNLSFGSERGATFWLPLAWVGSEFLTPRLFPWIIAHTQISWLSFASLSEFAGVYPLSFLMFWWTEECLSYFVKRDRWLSRKPLYFFGSFLILIASGAFAAGRARQAELAADEVNIGLVQGNLDAKEKGDIKYFESNLERYQDLSDQATTAGAELLLWPESVFNVWMAEGRENVSGSSYDPYPGRKVPLLYGVLSYRKILKLPDTKHFLKKPRLAFNSAFGVDEFGNVVGYYHKQVLMPFGEYLPFETIFPILRKISPYSGDFDRGDQHQPITFTIGTISPAIYPLICYEDLISALGREAVLNGATLLVNLTNDAWYGDTAAPYQHHLLAAWKAIETRRYLARVTNTGYTAVVNSLGETTSSLPLFTSNFLLSKIKILTGYTLYARIGDLFSWLVVGVGFFILLQRRVGTLRKREKTI